jgi:hypothetical protein
MRLKRNEPSKGGAVPGLLTLYDTLVQVFSFKAGIKCTLYTADMTRIQIRAVNTDGPPQPSQIKLQFSYSQKNKVILQNTLLPDTFIAEEMRWNLEDYAQCSLLETERAGDAKEALLDHVKHLAFSIHCTDILSPKDPKLILILEIEDSASMPPASLWEALERKEV